MITSPSDPLGAQGKNVNRRHCRAPLRWDPCHNKSDTTGTRRAAACKIGRLVRNDLSLQDLQRLAPDPHPPVPRRPPPPP